MPPLEDWFNIVSVCLGATCLEAPVKMNIAKTAGDLAIVEFFVAFLGRDAYSAQYPPLSAAHDR